MKNVTLIGMPGAGKSTVGVVLAKILGYGFTDCDLVIQNKTGKLLHDIISSEGNEGFINIENSINSRLECENCVIATGGSAVYGKEAMKHLSEISVIIYIRLPYDEIEKRLGNLEERGVVLENGESLKQLYDERSVFYEKYADIIFDAQKKDIQECAVEMADILRKHLPKLK